VLWLLRTHDEAAVTDAVSRALAHPAVSLITVRTFLEQVVGFDEPVVSVLDYAGPTVSQGSLSAYAALCAPQGVAHV